MRKGFVLFYFICFIIYFSAKAQYNAVSFVENVYRYQDSVKIVRSGDTKCLELENFDVDHYMKMFNALNIKKKNTRFKYVYLDNRLDAKPYIYVEDSLFSLRAFLDERDDKSELEDVDRARLRYTTLYRCLNDSINRACFNVVPEDSEEGYFQYLFFHEFGEQFALFWHANHKKRRMLCTENEMKCISEACISEPFASGIAQGEVELVNRLECDFNKIRRALKGGVAPKIKMKKRICEIVFYEMGFQGLVEKTYEIVRAFPYKVALKNEVVLAVNMPGFMF